MLSNLNIWSYFSDETPNNSDTSLKEPGIIENEENTSESAEDKKSDWGNYLIEMSKAAKNMAADKAMLTAGLIKSNMTDIKLDLDEHNIVRNFSAEQTRFKLEKESEKQKRDLTSGPWIVALSAVEDNGNAELREKVFSVSEDERNFLRAPPVGCVDFDYESHVPALLHLLSVDERLADMRFHLVPKRIKEDSFWRNYFYRISLIKDAVLGPQLPATSTEVAAQDEKRYELTESTEDDLRTEFVSDSVENCHQAESEPTAEDEFPEEDLEAQLQRELCEFELVNEDNGIQGGGEFSNQGGDSGSSLVSCDRGEYDDIEKEILDELQK